MRKEDVMRGWTRLGILLSAVLALVALAVWDARRSRVLTFGVGWYATAILPVIQWIPVGEAIMADRYAYLSYVGPLFALGMGASALAARAPAWRTGIAAACVAFSAFLFVSTVRQVEVWANSEALWTNVIHLQPKNDRGYLARGSDRGSAGRIPEAMADLKTARALGSTRGSLYDGLGNAFGALGQNDSALVMFDQGLALEPNMGRTHYNRAVVYLRLGRPADALADLDRARELLPIQSLEFHVLRGDAYLQLKRYREAAAEYDGAIRDGFGSAPVYNCRAYCRGQLGDSAGAAEDLAMARKLSGDAGAPTPGGSAPR
jgi:tetratricopeptide (TPR) repeat protein